MSQEKNCLQCRHCEARPGYVYSDDDADSGFIGCNRNHWSLTGEFGNARKIMDEHIRRAPTCQDFQE